MTPIYDYVEFFVTVLKNMKLIKSWLPYEIALIYIQRLGMTLKRYLMRLNPKSLAKTVEILNTIESLRQPAEMVSRLCDHAICDRHV